MKETHHYHAWIVPHVYRVAVLLFLTVQLVPAAAALVSPLTTTTTNVGVGRHNHFMTVESNDDVADSDAFLLEKEYELTEQMVAERGEIEELLMAASVSHLLLPNKLCCCCGQERIWCWCAAKNKMKKQTKHDENGE